MSAKGGAMLRALMERSPVPVFLTVTVWAALVMPTRCSPNASEVELNEMVGDTPAPVSETVGGSLPREVSSMVIESVCETDARSVGVNATVNSWVAFGASIGRGLGGETIANGGFAVMLLMLKPIAPALRT